MNIKHDYWLHTNCLDVYVYVHCYTRMHESIAATVSWINRGYTGDPWIIPAPIKNSTVDKIVITKEQEPNWVACDEYGSRL